MIRNSVDHGIEKPEARAARGKPAQGTVHLRAFHKGGNIVIQIQDDGAGLNQERILAKAVEKGIVKPGEQLAEKDIFALIFAAGFSTAEKVTELSGRGVGMDVVRRNIEQLRGKTEIQSTPGQGSTFTIYLPLTLAIIDGLIVGVGDQRYILPTLSVRESFRPERQMLSTVQQRGELVNVRGRLSPLLRLYDHFGVRPRSTDPTESVVVVVGSDHEHRCLLVDQLLGKQEVVIKGLGETFQGTRGLAGAAILGDGSVGLILDVETLCRSRAGTG
jgi:two-component system chemotaxis sensor kinase CheA